MSRNQPRRKSLVAVEPLEGRALLAAGASPFAQLSALVRPSLSLPGVKTDPAAVAAIMAALNGGAGSEFVTLLRRQAPNLNAVIAGFISGKTTQFTTPGIVAKIPKFQEGFTGRRYDHLSATLAGAVVLPKNTLELAMVTRGPFDEAVPGYVVFGLDRGAGARRGPIFSSRPGITPDALVTVKVGPYGKGSTAFVTDLTTGKTTALDPSKIQVQGAVVRVFVDLSKLPSQGRPANAYRFAAWTRSDLTGGIQNVGSFVAETTMTPVGVLKP
ncbi:MAG: hypothetical protein U0835_01240 [Isosphaeraceae bacterium]